MPAVSDSKYTVNAGWSNAPHIDDKTKAQMLEATPHWMRAARSEGVPSKGAGAIYPVDRKQYIIDPFPIPQHWPRGFGMDVGWNWTVANFFAKDPNTAQIYLYSEHYMGHEKPIVHAEAIKARGDWIPGVIDPAANSRGQRDGEQLLSDYQSYLKDLSVAENDVESGIIKVWQALAFGSLKVFSTCMYWISECEHYRRDDNGKIVKKNDHAMDATRYFYNSGIDRMKVMPADKLRIAMHSNSGFDASGY